MATKWLSSQAVAKSNARRGYFFFTVWPGRHLGGITLGIFTSSSRYLLCSTCLNKCVVAVAVRFDISTAKNKLSSWGKSRSAAVTSDAPAASKGRSKNDWAKQRKRDPEWSNPTFHASWMFIGSWSLWEEKTILKFWFLSHLDTKCRDQSGLTCPDGCCYITKYLFLPFAGIPCKVIRNREKQRFSIRYCPTGFL